MSMINFKSFHGTVTMINDFMIGQNGEGEGCYKLISVENGSGALNLPPKVFLPKPHPIK